MKLSSPNPIIAGIFNSSHLIDICELTPPNLVIRPFIPFEKIQSNPGSAFSITAILFFKIIFFDLPSKIIILPEIFLSEIKLGLDNNIDDTKKSLLETIRYGNFT